MTRGRRGVWVCVYVCASCGWGDSTRGRRGDRQGGGGWRQLPRLSLAPAARTLMRPTCRPRDEVCVRERIYIGLMTSDRKLEASRECKGVQERE